VRPRRRVHHPYGRPRRNARHLRRAVRRHDPAAAEGSRYVHVAGGRKSGRSSPSSGNRSARVPIDVSTRHRPVTCPRRRVCASTRPRAPSASPAARPPAVQRMDAEHLTASSGPLRPTVFTCGPAAQMMPSRSPRRALGDPGSRIHTNFRPVRRKTHPAHGPAVRRSMSAGDVTRAGRQHPPSASRRVSMTWMTRWRPRRRATTVASFTMTPSSDVIAWWSLYRRHLTGAHVSGHDHGVRTL
jgi:hypothetical protein